MAKLKMKKIEIVTLATDSKAVIDTLQLREVLQITKNDDELDSFETARSVSQFEKHSHLADEALSVLDKYAPRKKGLLSSFCDVREITEEEYENRASNIEEYMKKCSTVVELQKSINDLKAQIVRMNARIDAVRPWEKLDIPMIYNGSQNTKVFIGTLPGEQSEEKISISLAEKLPEVEDINVEVVSSSHEQTCVVITTYKANCDAVYGAIREMGFISPTDPTRHPPKVRISRLTKEIEDCNKQIDENIEKLRKIW